MTVTFTVNIDKTIDFILATNTHIYYQNRQIIDPILVTTPMYVRMLVYVCSLCVCVCVCQLCPLSRKVMLNQTEKRATVTQAQGLIHFVCYTENALPAQGSPRGPGIRKLSVF